MSYIESGSFSFLNSTPATQVRGNDGVLYDVPSLQQLNDSAAKTHKQAAKQMDPAHKSVSESTPLSDGWQVIPNDSGFDPDIAGSASTNTSLAPMPSNTTAIHTLTKSVFDPELPSAPPYSPEEDDVVSYPNLDLIRKDALPPMNPAFIAQYPAVPTTPVQQESPEKKKSSWFRVPSFFKWGSSKKSEATDSSEKPTEHTPLVGASTTSPSNPSSTLPPVNHYDAPPSVPRLYPELGSFTRSDFSLPPSFSNPGATSEQQNGSNN